VYGLVRWWVTSLSNHVTKSADEPGNFGELCEATLEDAVNVFSLDLFPPVNLDLKKTLPVLRS
jgi:hypothetical protein